MTSVLITGGLGYIGSRIATSLASRPGYQVTVTTRKTAAETVSYAVPGQIGIVHEASASGTMMDTAISRAQVVVHLAALNEIDSVKRPLDAMQVNVLDSFRILESAVAHGVKRFIYFSTAHIYGAPLKGHISETTLPRPVHPYALTHRAFEDFVTAAADSRKISAVVLRLSNSFGPPSFTSADRWTLLVNDLCRQAVEAGSMTLKSPGLQQRDFITLQDVCRAVEHFIQATDRQLQDGIFNLGGNNAMRVLDVARLVKHRFSIVYGEQVGLEAPAADAAELSKDYSLTYDIGKLLSTDFSLQNNVNQEIDDTIHFCKKHFGQR